MDSNTLSDGRPACGVVGISVSAGSTGIENHRTNTTVDVVSQQQQQQQLQSISSSILVAAAQQTSPDGQKQRQSHCNDNDASQGIDLRTANATTALPSPFSSLSDHDDKDTSVAVSSSSSSSSPPIYCENSGGGDRQRAPTLSIINRQGSQSSTKTCEVDCGDEERDTFSPVSNNSPSESMPVPLLAAVVPIQGQSSATPVLTSILSAANENLLEGAVACNGSYDLDNKANDDKQLQMNKMKSTPLSTTKEEKQRQNEEIVIMETSSISSETGSWESIFPHHVAPPLPPQPVEKSSPHADLRTCCTEFLKNERKQQLEPQSKQLLEMTSSSTAASSTTACFIDASSLRDEDEVLSSFPSLEGHQSVDDSALYEASQSLEPNTAQLETFHKAFKMCKAKPNVVSVAAISETPAPAGGSQGDCSNSSSCSSESPHKELNNLSDEEKLWKRENLKKHAHIKDQYDKDDPAAGHSHLFPTLLTRSEASVDDNIFDGRSVDLDSSDSSEVVKLRREQERKQGNFIFQHNIQQFGAAHTISPKVPFASDVSYTTDYSSSSPAPSLVWSDHDRSSRPSTMDDMDGGDGAGGGRGGAGRGSSHKLCVLPDTPHNSIVHIEPPSTSSSSIHKDYASFQQRDSGAYCSDATDSPVMMPRTPKRSKFDEANPIVSGGASIKDFNLKQCESPPVKRKTDSCPIVSGGFMSLDFEPSPRDNQDDEFRVKPKARKPISSAVTSWVVDMSDCKGERRRSTSSSSSTDNTGPAPTIERNGTGSSGSQKSGLGFYVSLNDMNGCATPAVAFPPHLPPTTANNRSRSLTKSLHEKKSTGTGFYVDLSESETSRNATPPPSTELKGKDQKSDADKKNIFSMFIDFGGNGNGTNASDKKNNFTKKEPFSLAARLCNSFTQKKNDDVMKASTSSTETLMSRSNNFQRNIESLELEKDSSSSSNFETKREELDQPPITVAAIRRISQQRNLAANETKRHSWSNNNNNAANSTSDVNPPDYKRSLSLSADKGLMHIIDKIPLISKTSSMSMDSSLSPFDDITCSKSELSTYSSNSTTSASGGEMNLAETNGVVGISNSAGSNNNSSSQIPVATSKLKKRRKDVQINETFDKSSIGSLTDGVLSKDQSPVSTTDTDDLTFQQDEDVPQQQQQREEEMRSGQHHQTPPLQQTSTRSLVMETIIETKETASPKKVPQKSSLSVHTMESLHATIEKQKQLLETVTEHAETSGVFTTSKAIFVKLSDMDKPMGKFELHSPDTIMSKSVGNHRQINRLFRDETTRARPHSWTMTRSTGNSFMNITNSVDNLRSLSRLFPNFSKEFSNSLPNDMILDNCPQINSIDYVQSDISADSSLASSFSRSGMDESSLSCRQPRRLGEDLLKMFLQEIATDMMVEVNGRRIKAHKCILRSRCQYFAAVLAGGWAHTAGNVVTLPGYSYSAVHFALCHIYSGASHPPDGISLMELAALADLLGLEGLKEVTAHALKTNYCHNFHKPCSGCIDGILQVLPVALNHALDDLYRKCLRWTCRHYLKVWPTRQFSQLPSDILSRCRQQIVAYLTSETVLDAVLDCDNLLSQLVPFRWGSVSENLVRDIMEAAYNYIGDHFASLIASDSFLSLGHDKSCHIGRLEGVLLRTASSLNPDQACRSYQRVTRLNTVLQAKVIKMPSNLGELAKELQGLQEGDLDWDPEYIRLVSSIMSAVEQCITRQCSRAMRVAAWQRMDLDLRKKIQTLARLTEPIDLRRNKIVAKAFSFSGNTRNQDLYQVKLAIQAHSKRALAQDTQLYKATTHTQTQPTLQDSSSTQTIEKGVQAYNEIKEATSKVLKTNSRVHVPQIINKSAMAAMQQIPGRTSHTGHRRTQSEAPISTANKQQQNHNNYQQYQQQLQPKVPTAIASNSAKANGSQPQRLVDIRPRYLEPRKPRGFANGSAGPVRSQTSSNIPSKGKHQISSSDSSRNSSPAMRKTAANCQQQKIGTKSINMSLDSLASPSRRCNIKGKLSDTNDPYADLCIDSLAESMKSTNKTISQESLGCGSNAKLSRSNPAIANNKVMRGQQQQQQNNKINTNLQAAMKTPLAAVNKQKFYCKPKNVNSTGSSPSSTTTKSVSRLSSVSSTNSPRDGFKLRSISVPGHDTLTAAAGGQPTPTTARKSFLSAKSREILARRAEKMKLQSTNCSGDEKSHSTTMSSISRTSSINKNSISNIPTRRPNSLQLKKPTLTSTTFSKASPQSQNHGNNNQLNAANNAVMLRTNFKENGKSSVANKCIIADKWSKNKIELLIESPSTVAKQKLIIEQQQRIETKLERSSTFCKESSDLDVNELQIIE